MEWKSIPGFSLYEASDTGQLRSLNYKRTGRKQVLKPALSKDGYLKTMLLGDDGKYHTHAVHWFITRTFFGNSNGLEVNHKDCNKMNNFIINLEYITKSQNVKHAYDNGLSIPCRGSLNGMAKLTEKEIQEIREYRRNFKGRYYGRKELAKKYEISEAHIKDIINKRRGIWSHV